MTLDELHPKMERPFMLYGGRVIDLVTVPDGYGVCFVCGIVPTDQAGRGCAHDGRALYR